MRRRSSRPPPREEDGPASSGRARARGAPSWPGGTHLLSRGSGGSSWLRLRRTASGQGRARTGAAPGRERASERARRLLQQPRRKSAAGQPDWLEGTLNKHPRAREREARCVRRQRTLGGDANPSVGPSPGRKASPALGGEANAQARGRGGGAANACAPSQEREGARSEIYLEATARRCPPPFWGGSFLF